MQNKESYQRVKKQAAAKIGFYTRAAIYVFVNSFLIIINLSTSSQYLWFKWPLTAGCIGDNNIGLNTLDFQDERRASWQMT